MQRSTLALSAGSQVCSLWYAALALLCFDKSLDGCTLAPCLLHRSWRASSLATSSSTWHLGPTRAGPPAALAAPRVRLSAVAVAAAAAAALPACLTAYSGWRLSPRGTRALPSCSAVS